MKESGDESPEFFVNPVHMKIYESSKARFLHSALGDAKLTYSNDDFGRAVDAELNALLKLPLANEEISLSTASSATDVTPNAVFDDLAYRPGLTLVLSQGALLMKSSARYMEVFAGTWAGMRRNMG